MFELESAYLDIEAINNGQWMSLGAEYPGVEILARGLSSPSAKKLRTHLHRVAPKSDRLSNGQISEEAEDRILKAVIARECVQDWRGIAAGGKPLEFSPETLESIMSEPRARAFSSAIVNAIVDLEQTRVTSEAEVVGNSKAPPDGS